MPGTAGYERYETYNRLMALGLLLIAAGWAGLGIVLPRGVPHWGAVVSLVGALIMAAATAAEFWLFSDLPYSGSNMRHVAYNTFSIGSWILLIGATASGITLWRQPRAGRAEGLAIHPLLVFFLVLSLPLEFVSFFTLSPFIGSAVLALVLGWFLVTLDGRGIIRSDAATSAG